MSFIIDPFRAGSVVTGPTWNSADKGAGVVLSNGALSATNVGSNSACGVRGTTGHSATGKFYFEVEFNTINAATNDPMVGVATASWVIGTGATFNATGAWGIQSSGAFCYGNGSNQASGVTYAANDILGIAVDLATGKIWMSKNNVWILSGNPSAGTNATWSTVAGTVYPAARISSSLASITARFALASFTYTPPTGFSEWT